MRGDVGAVIDGGNVGVRKLTPTYGNTVQLRHFKSSFPRRRESKRRCCQRRRSWIPCHSRVGGNFAGMTKSWVCAL